MTKRLKGEDLAKANVQTDEERAKRLRENISAELSAAEKNFVAADGSLSPFNAAELVLQAIEDDVLPPPLATDWLRRGLRAYVGSNGATNLNKAFGVGAKGRGRNTPREDALLKRRNEIYASWIFLLNSNGLAVEKAAALIWARDRMLRKMAGEYLNDLPELSPKKATAVETLKDIWWKDGWKKTFDKKPRAVIRGSEPFLVAYDGGNWPAHEVAVIFHLNPLWGWPKKELEAARKEGLKV